MAVYAEHPLHPGLAPFVEAAWTLSAGSAAESHLILPDGAPALLGVAAQADGAELAFAAGYADQPHMHREVRAPAGTGAAALQALRGRSVQDAAPPERQAA